ncbi:MAG TPA: hypothetical protein VLK30_04600 [Candidatus Limnocylindrales bacterium]|nr:hypothetical protein [Candidatus Limnocylindrales bacterium]
MTTQESERRLGIARRIVERLAADTDMRASLMAGSVAQGTADEHSDIDLLNYYERLPEPTTFDAVLRDVGAALIGPIGEPDKDGFVARYRLDEVEVQTGGELVEALERRLGRIAAGEVDWVTAKVAMGLLEGVPLFGAGVVRAWQARAAYPESLRRKEVEANLGWFPIWAIDAHLAARDAELFRRQMLLDGAFKVVAVLSAVNRLYFTEFQFKRAHEHASRMRIKPDRLADRLDLLANAAPSEAAGVLRGLVEETKEIVRAEVEGVDADAPWQPAKAG